MAGKAWAAVNWVLISLFEALVDLVQVSPFEFGIICSFRAEGLKNLICNQILQKR